MRAQKCGKYHPLHARCTPVSRPILFSGAMVRALLAGTKTQTRRAIKPQPPAEARDAGVIISGTDSNGTWSWLDSPDLEEASFIGKDFRCPYGVPGDLLVVRETWQRVFERRDGQRFTEPRAGVQYARSWIEYAATSTEPPPKWRPSIHMPRKYSRLTLRITNVRVERLQGISEADARAEGISWNPNLDPVGPCKWASAVRSNTGWNTAVAAYEELWESINGAGSWASNPFVWAIAFEKV